MATDRLCDACGINPAQAKRFGPWNEWHVCFTCIAQFVEETDATNEAFEWWIERQRECDEGV